MSFPTRRIGATDVSAMGYGAMGLSGFYGKALPDDERFKILDAVHAGGCRFWDSADVYADNEELIGRWFKRTGKRDEIFLASKCGFVWQPDRFINGTPEYTRQAVQKSLDTLGVDFIDLYYIHRPDSAVPIELTVGAMAEFVKAGKIKYLGISECSASTLRRAHAVHPISALQVEYSTFALSIEDEKLSLLKTARELSITIVAYSPLGLGLLTGQYKSPDEFSETDPRRIIPRYSAENFPKILQLADRLKQVGEKHDATAGQVALAWLLAQGEDIIPIPGTTKIKYLEENLGAVKVELEVADINDIRAEAENADHALGKERYPPESFVKTAYLRNYGDLSSSRIIF